MTRTPAARTAAALARRATAAGGRPARSDGREATLGAATSTAAAPAAARQRRRPATASGKHAAEEPARVARRRPRHYLRRPLGDHPAAALRPEVDDPVGRLDDVQVVLDHDHGVALVDEALHDEQELAHVLEVQARRRLVEDVEGPPRRPLGELGGELHPLGLAAGERGGALAEADVAEADVDERAQVAGDDGLGREELERLLARELQDVRDGAASPQDLEGVPVVAGALAHLARHVDVREEVHLDLDRPVPRAGLAATARHVEGEATG